MIYLCTLLGPGVDEVVSEMSPIVELSFSGVPSHHKTCFSRPSIVFGEVVCGMGYFSSHPVVASILGLG